jgi:hypothetical protein
MPGVLVCCWVLWCTPEVRVVALVHAWWLVVALMHAWGGGVLVGRVGAVWHGGEVRE